MTSALQAISDEAIRPTASPAPLWLVAPATLPLSRYRFTAILQAPLDLPEHAGSLLRGVFGAALRDIACSTGRAQCEGCALQRSCTYTALFETPPRPTQFEQRFSQVPHPYVIEPPPLGAHRLPAGTALVFHMVLIGARALSELLLVAQAWQVALARGLGDQRVRGQLASIEWIDDPHGPGADASVFDSATGAVRAHEPSLSLPFDHDELPREVALRFSTPLRLQNNGRVLRVAELRPRTLISHLLRRINLMLDLHMDMRPAPFDATALVALAATLSDDRSGLRWQDGRRYSARQQRDMPLDGAVGDWVLRGDLGPLLPWLRLGQWLHVGKAAVMGLGAYDLARPSSLAEPHR